MRITRRGFLGSLMAAMAPLTMKPWFPAWLNTMILYHGMNVARQIGSTYRIPNGIYTINPLRIYISNIEIDPSRSHVRVIAK